MRGWCNAKGKTPYFKDRKFLNILYTHVYPLHAIVIYYFDNKLTLKSAREIKDRCHVRVVSNDCLCFIQASDAEMHKRNLWNRLWGNWSFERNLSGHAHRKVQVKSGFFVNKNWSPCSVFQIWFRLGGQIPDLFLELRTKFAAANLFSEFFNISLKSLSKISVCLCYRIFKHRLFFVETILCK